MAIRISAALLLVAPLDGATTVANPKTRSEASSDLEAGATVAVGLDHRAGLD